MSHHSNFPEQFSGFMGEMFTNPDALKKQIEAKISQSEDGPKLTDLSSTIKKMEENQFGATNNFPDGKVTEHDSGEIKIGFAIKDSVLIMNFGEKPINWIGFTKKECEDIGNYLIEKSKELSV